ncbi:MAG: leucine-rich repeat domain-containing protein, partial [Muribaculaceae bacterium]|nr:leucine-rich repeat domain-containing protein [Muribaculaceae bacterium]
LYIGSNPFAGTYSNNNSDCQNKVELIIKNHRFFIMNNTLYSKKDRRLVSYLGAEELLEVLEGTEIIGENAFFDTQLKKIYLPRTINIVHKSAFLYCPIEYIFVPTGMITNYLCILPKYVIENVEIKEY